jgi:hypothetical protein
MTGWLPAALIAAAVAAVAYLVSLRLHPWRPCRSCRGSGKTRDRIWKPSTGTCPKCRSGRRPRLGVRVLQPARARDMIPAKGTHKAADRRKG